MLGWAIASGAGLAGVFVYRAWRQDAAIKSGEVMDVRDLLPEGHGDCLVRVLAERLYRVELQVEWTVADGAEARLPCRLMVTRTADDGDCEVVHDGTVSLVELQSYAAGSRDLPGGRRQYWGCLPLLEFQVEAIARLRFDAEATTVERGDGREIGRIEKANLVVKEGVRPMVALGARIAHLTVDDPHRL